MAALRLRLFLGLLICSITSAQNDCPNQEDILPCRCSQRADEIQIWCSHSELPHVISGLRAVAQAITRTIDELILENNNLPSLPGRSLMSLRIMRLMLRHNGLQRVSSGWLTGLEDSLMELYIVEKDLRSLPMDSVDKLRKLEAVTINSDVMKRIPNFSGLPRLRYLHVQSPSLIELTPRSFRMLPSIETIHVIGSPRLNRLEMGQFQDLPRLATINVSNCGISWIHLRALSMLPSLTELSLSGNKLSDAGMVGRALRDLPALSILRLDKNRITKLSEASFVDLPALRELFLSNNLIDELSYGAFHRVPMLKTLDLNHNFVQKVHPESFLQNSGSGLEELWLIDNAMGHISELRALLDALPRLMFLDMSYNLLEEIPFGALRGHPTLERLHLDHNRIQLVEREAFTAMPALRELRLKNNSLSNLLPSPLWNLPALKGLDLSQNQYRRVEPRLLENLPSLRKLDLSSNSIAIIDPASFLDTPQLEYINISNNALLTLHPATFRHLMELFELDVGFNRLVEFVPGLPRGLEYLHVHRNRISGLPLPPSPDLDLPTLKMLDLSGNGIQNVPRGAMRMLIQLRRLHLAKNVLRQLEDGSFDGLTRLELLDLHDNRIIVIHEDSLTNMAELKTLNLKGNRLEVLRDGLLRDVNLLMNLDISKNQIIDISTGLLVGTRDLQTLDASQNILTQFPETLQGLVNLQELDLSYNRIQNLPPETLNTLISLSELRLANNKVSELRRGVLQNLQLLKELDLSTNEIEVIEPGAIRSMPSLSSLKLGRNKLTDLQEGVFAELPNLQLTELQENNLHSISNRAFYKVPRMLMLNLSHNAIPSMESAGLRSLRSLEVLDLSHNKVSRVSSNSLQNMEWLVELKMDNNRICYIQGSPFRGMPRLRVLSLRNNKMSDLSELSVETLRSNIAVLDLDGNPLSCSCSLLWMRAWIQEASWVGPRCADGSMLRESRLSRQECEHHVRGLEPPVPGCESEPIPDTLTAPEAQPWMDRIKVTTKRPPNGIAPSPEESDYFYDEYIDYPFNESNFLVKPNNSALNINTIEITTVPSLTTVVSSHSKPGDTPAFYAGTIRNATSKPTIFPRPVPTSGFTFFGVPLPSLNIGKLWGAGRNVDQSADRKNDPVGSRGNGRVQMYPITRPDIEQGGFVPILPGTGGFTPIVNPSLVENVFHTTDASTNKNRSTSSWPSDFPSRKFTSKPALSTVTVPDSDIVSTTMSNIQRRGPILYPTLSTEMVSFSSTVSSTAETITISNVSNKEDKDITNATSDDYSQESGESTVPNTTETPSGLAGFLADLKSTENVANVQQNNSMVQYFTTNKPDDETRYSTESTIELHTEYSNISKGNDEGKIKQILGTSLSIDDSNLNSNTDLQDYILTSQVTENPNKTSHNNTNWTSIPNPSPAQTNPSSLSELLIPQQPPYNKVGSGRPTIVKVFSPSSILPTAEEYLRTPNPKDSESSESLEASNLPPKIANDDSMNWYFDNYNKTSGGTGNMVPFLEPGLNRFRSSSGSKKNKHSIYMMAVAIFYVIFNENV